MKWVLLLMVTLTSILLFTGMLQALFLSDKKLNRRIKHYLELNDKRKLGRKRFNLLVQMQLYKETVRDKVLTKQKSSRLEAKLSRAGLSIKPEEYILFQWIAMALGGGLLVLLSSQILFLPVGVIIGYMLPRWVVNKKEHDRIAKFNDSLSDMITTAIGSLRAGFSFAQALKTVVEESESPIQEEIDQVLKEMQYGTTMEDALYNLKERMPSGDLDLMIQAILIQRQVGGNLAVVLETIVQTIRDRNKIQRQIKTLTAQGRLSGMVIGALPAVLGFLLYLIEPAYIGTLFSHPVGIMLLAAGTISCAIGFVIIRKLTRIEV